MEWVYACALSDVTEGQLISLDICDKKIMVANLAGRLYAADRTCTHEDADLSGGFVSDEGVRCPLHLSVFGLDDGHPLNPPAQDPIITYNVKIEKNGVFVEV